MTKHDEDEDLQEASEESEQRPELRGGGDNLDHQRFHPRRRPNFEAMKHRLSPGRRADTEYSFDRVAALNPSWVHCSTTFRGQPPLTPAAVAQNSNLNLNLTVVTSLQMRILSWLDSITLDSTSGQESWSSPRIHDDGDAAQLVQFGESLSPKEPPSLSGLSLRGGADNCDEHLQQQRERRIGSFQCWRRVLYDQLLAGADATRPIWIPGQVSCGPPTLRNWQGPREAAYSMRVFTSFPDPGVDRRATIERWLDTVILEGTDRRHTRLVTTLEKNGEFPTMVLQLTSNDAMDLALAFWEDSSLALEMGEAGQDLATEQDVPIAQTGGHHHNGLDTYLTVPGLDSNVHSVSDVDTFRSLVLTLQS